MTTNSVAGHRLPKVLVALWMMVLVSGLCVVYSSHQCRLLNSELALREQEKHSLEVVWAKYLLEESSLASLSRVEKLARQKLNMQVPVLEQIVMVKP